MEKDRTDDHAAIDQVAIPKVANEKLDAQQAAIAEHQLPLGAAFKAYKKAILWSVCISFVRV